MEELLGPGFSEAFIGCVSAAIRARGPLENREAELRGNSCSVHLSRVLDLSSSKSNASIHFVLLSACQKSNFITSNPYLHLSCVNVYGVPSL